MADKRFYVISYDIVDDRKRAKAADTIKDFGIRVQKSVFECRLGNKALKRLLDSLIEIIDKETDSVLIYSMCESCSNRKQALGISFLSDDEEFCVL